MTEPCPICGSPRPIGDTCDACGRYYVQALKRGEIAPGIKRSGFTRKAWTLVQDMLNHGATNEEVEVALKNHEEQEKKQKEHYENIERARQEKAEAFRRRNGYT